MRRAACLILAILLLTLPAAAAEAGAADGSGGGADALTAAGAGISAPEVAAPSAILMEKVTGEILYEKNSTSAAPRPRSPR